MCCISQQTTQYHKIGILSTGMVPLADRMGAYVHGMLINTCKYLLVPGYVSRGLADMLTFIPCP